MQNGTNGLCEFCQYANGDEYAAGFNVYYSKKWEDYGVFWAYCAFNFMVVFLSSWLFLGRWKKVKAVFSASATKERAAQAGSDKA